MNGGTRISGSRWFQTLFFSSPRPPLGPQAKISLTIAFFVLPCFDKYARRSIKLHKKNLRRLWGVFPTCISCLAVTLGTPIQDKMTEMLTGAASLFLVSTEVFIFGKCCQTSSLGSCLLLEAKVSIMNEEAVAPDLRYPFIEIFKAAG